MKHTLKNLRTRRKNLRHWEANAKVLTLTSIRQFLLSMMTLLIWKRITKSIRKTQNSTWQVMILMQRKILQMILLQITVLLQKSLLNLLKKWKFLSVKSQLLQLLKIQQWMLMLLQWQMNSLLRTRQLLLLLHTILISMLYHQN